MSLDFDLDLGFRSIIYKIYAILYQLFKVREGRLMNIWYITAIIFGAIAAFCAYKGSVVEGRRSSQEQTSHIESKLQTLGMQIQDLRVDPNSANKLAKIQEIDDKYKSLAEEFFRSAPIRVAEEKMRTAKQRVEDVQKAQEVEAYFKVVKREVEKLAIAYNNTAQKNILKIESGFIPNNAVHSSIDHSAYILLIFSDSKYWGIRIVSYPDRILALQFVHLLSTDGSANYQKMQLTNDSINLVFFKDHFGISLNQSISTSVKANITDGLPSEFSLDKFEIVAAGIARKIIEFELLSFQEHGTEP